MYLVGQSLGARAALALQERYPHRFAASLLVSGAWNPATASRLKDEHLLFVAADADSDTKAEVMAYIKQLKKPEPRQAVRRWTWDKLMKRWTETSAC